MTEHTKKPTVKQLQKEQENLTNQLMYVSKKAVDLQSKVDWYERETQKLNDKIETLEIQLDYERSGLFSRIMRKVGLGEK